MSFDSYPRYIPTTVNKSMIAKSTERLKKLNTDIQPVIIEGRLLAKNWWGKAWNQNLESYADYSNRISRGKSYVRSGAVLDLKITRGTIEALVQGSRVKPYSVTIKIDTLSKEKWDKVIALCNYRIDSLEQLVEGWAMSPFSVTLSEVARGIWPVGAALLFQAVIKMPPLGSAPSPRAIGPRPITMAPSCGRIIKRRTVARPAPISF
jgi:hypothetical protein